jgi:hypothetical protein
MAPYGMYGQQFPGNYPSNTQPAAASQQPPQQHRQGGGPFSPVGSPIGYQGYPSQFAQFGQQQQQQQQPSMSGAGAYHTGYQDRPQQHSSSSSANSTGNAQ